MQLEVSYKNKKEIVDEDNLYDYIYEEYTEVIEEAFCEMVEDIAETPFKICGYKMDEGKALKDCDEIAYWLEVSSWYDYIIRDVSIVLLREQDTEIAGIRIKIMQDLD